MKNNEIDGLIYRSDFAVSLVDDLCHMILSEYQQSQHFDFKNDNSVVTKTDIMVDQFIKMSITKKFHDDGIIAEESDNINGKSGFVWTIDPIDGTICFLYGIPFYSCLIGLLYNSEPVFGLAIFPSLDEYVFATKGMGMFWKKTRDKLPARYHLSSQNALIKQDLVFGFTDLKMFQSNEWKQILDNLIKRFRHGRTWGDAFGHIMVATGRLPLMIDPNPFLQVWDIVPVFCIVKESGARCITLHTDKNNIYNANGMISSVNDELLSICLS